MGFIGNKSIVYTKNKFEEYLNNITKEDFIKQFNPNEEYINTFNCLATIKKGDKTVSLYGTALRRKHKLDFNREYLIWLNTK